MIPRRSLSLPIALAVVMILLIVTLTVGWVILLVRNALQNSQTSGTYWALLSVGAVFFAIVLVGVIIYLTLSIKAINLNQRQSNFIDSVTHELKSPIASLKLYLQTLSRHTINPAEQQTFYRSMLEDVERLDQLINHLLDAARIEKPVLNLEPEVAMDLAEVLKNVAQSVCQVHGRDVSCIQFDLPPTPVVARRVDIDVIFRNLIDNAVKYAGEPPQVTLTSRIERTNIVVRITDNGQGIPAPLRHKVFGRFVRLGTELERTKPGTGLGLYLVRATVRRLRGQVRLTSGPEGRGTAVVVKLPRESLETAKLRRAAEKNEPDPASEPHAE